jgi:hypothetical protein
MKRFSDIKILVDKPEFWLAIITGITLSIGFAPTAYVIYFERFGSSRPSMTHYGPLWATLFGYQLCYANLALLFTFPLITFFLTTNYRKTRPNNISRLWFVLSFLQFTWGLMNWLPLFWLLE